MDLFNVQPSGDVTVVEFTAASLMDNAQLESAGQQLELLVDADHRRLVLDFSKVQYLSSQAIGVLLSLQKKLAEHDRSALLLCGVGARLLELLRITRLDRVLTVKPTRQEAIAALA